MLRAKQAKQRKVRDNKIPPAVRPKRTTLASSSSKSLQKISYTKWIVLCGILTFIFIIYWITNNENALTPQNINKDSTDLIIDQYIPGRETIYVSIATLGDHACPMTVNDLFKQAKFPSNLYIGIYQQNEGSDPDCLGMLEYCDTKNTNTHPTLGDITVLCTFKDHIRINRTDIADGAKGPVYGRYMSMKLRASETDFVCMIDSHTLFRAHWDEYTLRLWYAIEPNHRRAVLTHYPWGAEHLSKRITEGNEYSYHICGSVYEGGPNFMLRNANGCFAKKAVKPVRVPFFAGGFSFAHSRFWSEVPLDPHLLYIFNGEEFDIATRGWTFGYDFYSPNADIVGHYYDKGPKRRSPHVGRNRDSHALRDKSERRLNYLWGLWDERYGKNEDLSTAELRELDKYGLGNKRSLSQFWKFAGIDPINKTITVFKERMYSQGGLEYVPY